MILVLEVMCRAVGGGGSGGGGRPCPAALAARPVATRGPALSIQPANRTTNITNIASIALTTDELGQASTGDPFGCKMLGTRCAAPYRYAQPTGQR